MTEHKKVYCASCDREVKLEYYYRLHIHTDRHKQNVTLLNVLGKGKEKNQEYPQLKLPAPELVDGYFVLHFN